MVRTLILTIAVLGMCSLPIGCNGDDASSNAAKELGIQEGTRPKPDQPRKPPGPPQGEIVREGGDQADQESEDTDEP